MACIPVPVPELPSLPAGITLKPPPVSLPGGGVDLNIDLCCKLPPIQRSFQIPPIPGVALVLTSTIVDPLNIYIDQVLAYLAKLPLACPLE